ncbi:hypothetical protein M3A95_04255 [Micrococcus luteus]|nr:hypothetical protein [Micrococcus luteus]
MADYYMDNTARILEQIRAHHDADPAPLADAGRAHHGDMHAGVVVGQAGTIHAHTRGDAAGTHRVYLPGEEAPVDLWAARERRVLGPTVHVPLRRIFSGQGAP